MPGRSRYRTSSITASGGCSISSAWRPTWSGVGASRRKRTAERGRRLSEGGADLVCAGVRTADAQDRGEIGALRRIDRRVPQFQVGLQVGRYGGDSRAGLTLAARLLAHGVLHDVLALDLQLVDALAVALDPIGRQRREAALQPAPQGAQRADDLALPGFGHGLDRLQVLARQQPSIGAGPAAVQQHVDVEAEAVLQADEGRGHTRLAVEPDGKAPERAVVSGGHGV